MFPGLSLWLFGVGVLTGAAHVVLTRLGSKRWALLFKPVPVLLCLGWVLAAGQGPSRPWIAVGLLFSVAGDVLLGLPVERFRAGLASFLIAHLAYTVGFLLRAPPAGTLWLVVGLGLYLAGMCRLVLPGTGRLRGPVVAYIGVIATMVWVAAEGWVVGPSVASRRALAGACLFMISDSILAIHRFYGAIPGRKELVMTTYYGAQFWIAASCVVP